MTILKTVEYSYPSSTNATRFGFGDKGCYTVEEIKQTDKGSKTVAIAAYLTKPEAVKHAETLPHQWHPLYLKYNS